MIEIRWSGSAYGVRNMAGGGFVPMPFDNYRLDDIEKLKPSIIEAIEYKGDLDAIKAWDGII